MPTRPSPDSQTVEDVAAELGLLQGIGFCTLGLAVSIVPMGFCLMLSLPHTQDNTQVIIKALTGSLLLIGGGFALARAEDYWPYTKDALNTFFGGNQANRRFNNTAPDASHIPPTARLN